MSDCDREALKMRRRWAQCGLLHYEKVVFLYYHSECFLLFINSNICVSVTVQNYTHVHTSFYFTMTDTISSKYIDIIS
jgi:hypothetical protein